MLIIDGKTVKEYDNEEIFDFDDGYLAGLTKSFIEEIIDRNEYISITVPKCIKGKPVEVISRRAFVALSNLISFQLAEDSEVRIIADEAFFNCSNLVSIDINRPSLWKIGEQILSLSNPIMGFHSVINELDLSQTSLIVIPEKAFYQTLILSIKLPKSIETIKKSAFQDSALSSINLNELTNLDFIEEKAFSNCKIESIPKGFLPDCIYGNSVFSECKDLKDLYIPAASKFEARAFFGCEKLASVEFDDNNFGIPDKMFRDCPNLQNVKLPHNLSSIGVCAFEDDIRLEEIIYPGSLKIVEISAFAGCGNLVKFIPETKSNIDKIGDRAFFFCTNLIDININSSTLTYLGYSAFSFTTKLEELELDNTNLKIIREDTFSRSGLKRISLPNCLMEIEEQGFWGSEFEEIDFSNTQLTSIGKNAFCQCTNLRDIQLPYFISKIYEDAFSFTIIKVGELIKSYPFCELIE